MDLHEAEAALIKKVKEFTTMAATTDQIDVGTGVLIAMIEDLEN